MATLPVLNVEQPERKLTAEEAAEELYRIVEEHFDELGLSEEERDARYAAGREYLDARDVANAKA